ncbi:hypothetical protein K8R42_00545 [bacterium]|nr:hypothetical protein [bacterium]
MYFNKRVIFLILALFVATYTFVVAVSGYAYNNSWLQGLRGYILLQVEENGEAWYVDPLTTTRIYMENGTVAYGVMRDFGLGITDADLAKIRVGIEHRFECIDNDDDGLCNKLEEGLGTDINNFDSDGDSYDDGTEIINNYNPLAVGKLYYDDALADRLKGQIVLQVEKDGQAWYINPRDGRRYYMTDGQAAYQIMKFLSLGITNTDLEQIHISSYVVDESEDESSEQNDSGTGGASQEEDNGSEESDNEGGEEGDQGADENSNSNFSGGGGGGGSSNTPSQPVCGNNILESGEECDGSAGVSSGYICSISCQLEEAQPECNNGIVESGEECDGSAGVVEGYQCNDSCQLEEIPPEIQYSINFKQPYENSFVLAQSDVPEGSSYQWSVDGQSVESGIMPTTFLAHFNGDLSAADGEDPIEQASVIFEDGKFDQGLRGAVEYSNTNNIDFNQGTMDMWLTLKASLDSSLFDSEPYFFRYRNDDTGDVFALRVYSNNHLTFMIYDDSQGWGSAVQLGTAYHIIPTNESVFVSMTWSTSEKVAKFYINGEQISRRDYEGDFPYIAMGTENLIVGNPNIVLDEFRILNKPLSVDEIRENYKRGIPFSASDLVYSGDISNGQTISLNLDTDQGQLEETSTVSQPKIVITSPDDYFIPNTSDIGLQFSTPSAMTCHYGDLPDTYENLPYQATGTGTSHTISQSARSIVDQYPFAIKCQAAGGDGDDYGFFRQYRVLPAINNNYPKISKLWWGNSATEEEVDFLARFDQTSLSKSNAVNPKIVRQIKEINPNIILLLYKGAIVHQDYSSVAYKSFSERIDQNWRLQSSEQPGTYCINHYFAANILYNLNSNLPYVSTAAEHMEKDIFDRQNYFDGIWWDVTGPDLWFLRDGSGYDDFCDFNLDGIDEDLNVSEDLLLAKEVWAEGMHQQMQLSRDRLGHDMITLGNGNAVDHADYNGKQWERNFSPSTFDSFFNPNNTQSFFYWQEHSLEPRMNENLFKNIYPEGYSSYYRYHRYGMAASLMAGIYYNATTYTNDNRFVNWFDEHWIDKNNAKPTDDPGIGRGYLGEPVGDAYIDANGIYRRDFRNGIVLLNHTFTVVEADLGGQFRYILGSEDPIANPGGTTYDVSLSAYDGRILLRSLCKDNPDLDPLCIE